MALDSVELVPFGYVPDLDGLVVTGGDQEVARGMKLNGVDCVGVSGVVL